jgi:tetratricopeptide (TPR) repeat protein
MDQLFLFANIAPLSDAAPDAAPAAAGPKAVDEPDPVQPGLFDARLAQLRAVRLAIAAGQLDGARSLLASLEPGPDLDVTSTRERISEIVAELGHAEAQPTQDRAVALAGLARVLAAHREPWSGLGRTLLRRAAHALEGELDATAGRLYLESGDIDRARDVLTEMLSRARSATLLFALGDVETRRGDRTSARRCYRDALLLDPFDAAFEETLDDEVRGLVDVAETEVEVESEPCAWAAAVGMVAGILVPPTKLPVFSEPVGLAPIAGEAIRRMRQFVRALSLTVHSRTEVDAKSIVEARRIMKSASPALFAYYMARRAPTWPPTRN